MSTGFDEYSGYPRSSSVYLKVLRKILHIYLPGERLRDDDELFVGHFFSAHPEHERKIARRKISHFEVRVYKFQTRAFFAVFEDGSFIHFSFYRCVKAYMKQEH